MAHREISGSDLRTRISKLLEESRNPPASKERNVREAVASFVGSAETIPREQPSPREVVESETQARLEVRPIGTPLGLRELANLHKKTWSNLNVAEKRVHLLLWPLALHFGLYKIKAGQEQSRPPLIGAFWARCLADAPLTLGHLYPTALFKGVLASDVWEFGGMVIDTTYQGKGLAKLLSDTARIFLFSRRPKLLITNPIEPLYEMYRQARAQNRERQAG